MAAATPFLSGCSSGSGDARTPAQGATTASSGGTNTGAATLNSRSGVEAGGPVATSAGAPTVGVIDASTPVTVSVSDTSGLHDGDEVSVHVEPKGGSQVFGFEAIVCAGGARVANDADIRPTYTGKCITKPLSPISEKYMAVKAEPPYAAADGKFRVGVGTNTYTTRTGDPVTITCGPRNPCQLVLKLQYPNGFGFAAYPLTFN